MTTSRKKISSKPAAKRIQGLTLEEKKLRAAMDVWWEEKVKPIRKLLNDEEIQGQAPAVRAPLDSVARVLFLAADVFENRDSAVSWMCSACVALGNKTPASILEGAGGEEKVVAVLRRIEYGVYG